jgi:hypothetical protein
MPLPMQRNMTSSRLILISGMIVAGVALSACSQSSRADYPLMSGETPSSKNDPYPDFSKPLTSAMDQMSDEEATKMEAQLSALAAQRRSRAISEAEYLRRVNEMKKLYEEMRPDQPSN